MASDDRLFSDGAAYERLMGRWSRRAGNIFLDWIDAAPNRRWLDVGCGTGAFTEELSRRCAPAFVTAIDPSADQLAYARGRPGLQAIDFQVGDAQALAFPDASFDAAVMALVIHFVPDPAKGVAEMARVLKPGGLAAAYVWDYAGKQSVITPLVAAIKAIGIDAPPPPTAGMTSLQALDTLWRNAGFIQIETRPIAITVEFADFEDFWTSMTVPVGRAGKAVAQMSQAEKERLRAALLERVPPAADGRTSFGAVANAVKGWKP